MKKGAEYKNSYLQISGFNARLQCWILGVHAQRDWHESGVWYYTHDRELARVMSHFEIAHWCHDMVGCSEFWPSDSMAHMAMPDMLFNFRSMLFFDAQHDATDARTSNALLNVHVRPAFMREQKTSKICKEFNMQQTEYNIYRARILSTNAKQPARYLAYLAAGIQDLDDQPACNRLHATAASLGLSTATYFAHDMLDIQDKQEVLALTHACPGVMTFDMQAITDCIDQHQDHWQRSWQQVLNPEGLP